MYVFVLFVGSNGNTSCYWGQSWNGHLCDDLNISWWYKRRRKPRKNWPDTNGNDLRYFIYAYWKSNNIPQSRRRREKKRKPLKNEENRKKYSIAYKVSGDVIHGVPNVGTRIVILLTPGSMEDVAGQGERTCDWQKWLHGVLRPAPGGMRSK